MMFTVHYCRLKIERGEKANKARILISPMDR